MKKILMTMLLALVCIVATAQIKLCGYFGGYWSEWRYASTAKIYGGYNGFIIYDSSDGPWYPYFKFTISNYYIPSDKGIRKNNIKNNSWYEFSGTVEYYISDDYLSAYENFKKKSGPSFVAPKPFQDKGRPVKKITSRARIKIAPFKDHPRVYNIWFDKVGLGIDLNDIHF